MRTTNARRSVASLALLLTAGLTVAACGEEEGSGSAGDTSPGEGESECAGLTEFGELSGKTVKLYTSIVAPEDKSQKDSYQLFSDCTGATVAYEGSNEFEAQLVVRVQSGNPPDIAYVPQPGLLKTLVTDTKKVVEAPASVWENTDEFFGEDWKTYGTVAGKFYAAPLGANVKSFCGTSRRCSPTTAGPSPRPSAPGEEARGEDLPPHWLALHPHRLGGPLPPGRDECLHPERACRWPGALRRTRRAMFSGIP